MLKFDDATVQEMKRLMAKYPEGKSKSALLPILHLAQEKAEGWLSQETMDAVAEVMGLVPIEVYEVATFYTMFNLRPCGKYVFEVCHTGPCALVGAEKIIGHLSKRLGIKSGQTTEDGLFTLKTAECLASCGTGPMMQFDGRYIENLTEEKIDQLLDELKQVSAR